MKKFLAVYIGSLEANEKWAKLSEAEKQARQVEGIKIWSSWGDRNSKMILDIGAPLGKTKKVGPNGISDIKNQMTAYTLVEAESHEAAAKLFLDHPHFKIFPGDSIEIMECLALPKM